jgi:hypothetical protein
MTWSTVAHDTFVIERTRACSSMATTRWRREGARSLLDSLEASLKSDGL